MQNQGFLEVKLKPSFWKFYVCNHDLIKRNGISATDYHRYVPFIVTTILSSSPHSWLIIRFFNKINKTGITGGIGTAYPSRAHPRCLKGFMLQALYLVFCVVFCDHCLFFFLYLLTFVLSSHLWFVPSDCILGVKRFM